MYNQILLLLSPVCFLLSGFLLDGTMSYRSQPFPVGLEDSLLRIGPVDGCGHVSLAIGHHWWAGNSQHTRARPLREICGVDHCVYVLYAVYGSVAPINEMKSLVGC